MVRANRGSSVRADLPRLTHPQTRFWPVTTGQKRVSRRVIPENLLTDSSSPQSSRAAGRAPHNSLVAKGDGMGRLWGTIEEWDDDRGFGFISPPAGQTGRVLVHVSALPRGRRPAKGHVVTYVEGRDERGRRRALEVRYADSMSSGRRAPGGVAVALAAAAVFVALLAALVVVGDQSVLLLLAYGVMSALTFVIYGADKSAAERREWRTPESTLHAMAVIGGWPGALVARQQFRHKTTKQPFTTIFWLTVVANLAALAWFVNTAPVTLP